MKFRIAALLAIVVAFAQATIGASADEKTRHRASSLAAAHETSEVAASAETSKSQDNQTQKLNQSGQEQFQIFRFSAGSRL